MERLINEIGSSILQISLFGMIPFVWWLITARKRQKFTEWMGLKKIRGGKKTLIGITAVSAVFLATGALTLYAIRGVETAASGFAGLGAAAIPAIVIYAAFHTAFPEELLFRGFLLKRLTNKVGFHAANAIQAVLFALLHGAMFFTLTGAAKASFITVFTGAAAWSMGYVNEKCADGSIAPSWIIHTVSNLFSGMCAAFSIL